MNLSIRPREVSGISSAAKKPNSHGSHLQPKKPVGGHSVTPKLPRPSTSKQSTTQTAYRAIETTEKKQVDVRKGMLRSDDLEEARTWPGWKHDPGHIATNLGDRKEDSRMRSNGVIVFDCLHTAPPTRVPVTVPPVVWFHGNPEIRPWPTPTNCHDCDCESNYEDQLKQPQNIVPSRKINQLKSGISEAKAARKGKDVISKLEGELRILEGKRAKTWAIWKGWEGKWGEKLHMNDDGYVYGAKPSKKSKHYIAPPLSK